MTIKAYGFPILGDWKTTLSSWSPSLRNFAVADKDIVDFKNDVVGSISGGTWDITVNRYEYLVDRTGSFANVWIDLDGTISASVASIYFTLPLTADEVYDQRLSVVAVNAGTHEGGGILHIEKNSKSVEATRFSGNWSSGSGIGVVGQFTYRIK